MTKALAGLVPNGVEALYTNGSAGGNVPRSLSVDMHGKGLSPCLPDMDI